MKRTSRFISFLSVVLCTSLFLSMVNANKTYALTFSESSLRSLTPADVQAEIRYLINNGFAGKNSTYDWKNCKYFVDSLSSYLYGVSVPGQKANPDYVCPPDKNDRLEPDEVTSYTASISMLNEDDNWSIVGEPLLKQKGTTTASDLKNLFSQAQPGDVVQMDLTKVYKDNSNSYHAAMIYSVSDTGVAFYHYGPKYKEENGKKIRVGGVIYGSSSNQLYSTSFTNGISHEVTYERLADHLQDVDDGLSIYRCKYLNITDTSASVPQTPNPVTQPPVTQPPVTQPPVTQAPVTPNPVTEVPKPEYASYVVSNEKQFLDAVKYAATADKNVHVTIGLASNININVSNIGEEYSSIVWKRGVLFPHETSGFSPASIPKTTVVNEDFLQIKNCKILGLYNLSIDNLIVASDATIEVGSTDKPYFLDSGNALRCKNLYNFGVIKDVRVDGELRNESSGKITYFLNMMGNFCNLGKVDWVVGCHMGINYGTVSNYAQPQNPSVFFMNYGTIDTFWSSTEFERYMFGAAEVIPDHAILYMLDGKINNLITHERDGKIIEVFGGNVPNASYYVAYKPYSIKVTGFKIKNSNHELDLTYEQTGFLNYAKNIAPEWISSDYRADEDHDGKLEDYTSFVFYLDNESAFNSLYNVATALLKNGVIPNVYDKQKTTTISALPKANLVMNLNGSKLVLDFYEVLNHSEFLRGEIISMMAPVIKNPHTIVLEDIVLNIQDETTESTIICDNGRVVLNNVTNVNGDPIIVEFRNPNDVLEVVGDKDVAIVNNLEDVTGTPDIIVLYGENSNGVSTITAAGTLYVYSSIDNALNEFGCGCLYVLSDAEVDSLAVSSEINIYIQDVTVTVNGEPLVWGFVGGDGTLVVDDIDTNYIDGYFGDDLTIISGVSGEVIKPAGTSTDPVDPVTPEPTEEPTPIITDEPTPVITEEPTVPVTPDPVTPEPTQPVIKDGLYEFAERLYTCALGRESDAAGIETWVGVLSDGSWNGAQAAHGFLFSDEITTVNPISDEEFINRLYKTFMNRDADPQGYETWTKAFADGWTREQVFQGFVDSQEWANVCYKYGIVSGGNCPPNVPVEPSSEVVAFATRLYTTCLCRDGEEEGIKNWSEFLANHKVSGSEAAHGFFFSEELVAQNISNEEFVDRLYRTFMGREADPAGREMWVGLLDSGEWDREAVFGGFAQSNEFAGICAEYGIDV